MKILVLLPSPCARVMAAIASTFYGFSLLAAMEAGPRPKTASQPGPWSPDSIRALMHKVNDWQATNPKKGTPERNWIRGTWYTGVMAAGMATGDERFIQQALDWGDRQAWQVGTDRSGGNILTCTQTYLELYFLKKDRAFIEPTIQWLDSDRPNTPTGALPHTPNGPRVWYFEGGRRYADSLYVGTPPLAMLAKATGDRKYIDWMHAFFWDVHQEIFDEAAGLYYRDKRFIGASSPNGRKVFWSRGNGWVFASLPRILAYLPADDPLRERYVALFRKMAASLAPRQQPDGLWRSNLDDAAEFPAPETSGTGFFCYGFAGGIRLGLFDSATYLPVVKKAWAGLADAVDADGKVQWGQGVAASPGKVQQPDSHEYVTGTFLLAASEVYLLARKGMLEE